jgi:hypothetical protein
MSSLNNIIMGFNAMRRLGKPPATMTPKETCNAVQAVAAELVNDEVAFAAGHSHLDDQDLGKRHVNAKQAAAFMAAGNTEAALRAVVAFWDRT